MENLRLKEKLAKHFTLLQTDIKPTDEDEKKRLWKYCKITIIIKTVPNGNKYFIGFEVFKVIGILSNNSIIRVGPHVHP